MTQLVTKLGLPPPIAELFPREWAVPGEGWAQQRLLLPGGCLSPPILSQGTWPPLPRLVVASSAGAGGGGGRDQKAQAIRGEVGGLSLGQ